MDKIALKPTHIKCKKTEQAKILTALHINSLVIKHECRDESEIYNYQRIQLSNNGILVGGGGGVTLDLA